MLVRQRRQDDCATHALAQCKHGHAGIASTDGFDAIGEIVAQRFGSRPDAGVGRLAEAALIVSIGGDALLRPPCRGHIECIRIIAHAVQRDDHGARMVGIPMAQRQMQSVAGEKRVRVQCGRLVFNAERRNHRGACGQ